MLDMLYYSCSLIVCYYIIMAINHCIFTKSWKTVTFVLEKRYGGWDFYCASTFCLVMPGFLLKLSTEYPRTFPFPVCQVSWLVTPEDASRPPYAVVVLFGKPYKKKHRKIFSAWRSRSFWNLSFLTFQIQMNVRVLPNQNVLWFPPGSANQEPSIDLYLPNTVKPGKGKGQK